MKNQEIIDFIVSHFDNYNLVYIARNDDHDERLRVEDVAYSGIVVRSFGGYNLEIVKWDELKNHYHLQVERDMFEHEDELIETLKLFELKTN